MKGMILGLLLLCGVAFFLGNDRPGLLEKDEPRYAETGRAMARSGDWLVPRFNGKERLVKPPLTYWAMAASFRATGSEDERSARLPSAVAGLLTVLLVGWGAARAFGPRWGFVAGGILATMLQFLVQARLATTDMLFTLFFTAAAGALLPVLEGSARAGRWILLSGLFAALGGLVKTPLALLPLAAALGAALLLGRLSPGGLPDAFRPGRRLRTAAAFVGALALFAALFLAWQAAADRATEGRLSEALRREIALRGEVHVEPFWYFLEALPVLAFPWTLLLPSGAFACLFLLWEERRRASLAALSVLTALVVIGVFSAIPSKLASYALPALPALALVATAGLRAMVEESDSPPGVFGRRTAGAFGLLAALAIAAAPVVPALAERAGPALLHDAAPALAAFGGLLAAGAMLALARRPLAMAAAFALVPLSLLFTTGPLLPRLEEEKCARGFVEALRREGLRPGDRIYDAGNSLTGVPWYADHPTETKPNGNGFAEEVVRDALASDLPTWAIVEHDIEDRGPNDRRTQWERMLAGLPSGVPLPRVVFRGMGRLLVTNTPEGPRPPK